MKPVLRIVHEASPAERRYRREAARLVKDLDKLDAKTMRAIAQRTRALRAQLINDLSEVSQWTAARLPVLLRELEAAIDAWELGVTAEAADAITKGGVLGSELAGRFEVAAGASDLLTVITPEAIEALAAASGELVTDVTTTIRKSVAAEARAASLGLKRPFEAIEAVASFIPPTKIRLPNGRTAYRGPAARAEVIVRTETNRAFSFANHTRIDKLAADLDEKPLKQWLTAIDGRERPDHAAADGQTVPHDQPFNVGGARLMFPNDPAGPAEQVINCRCTMITVLPSWNR